MAPERTAPETVTPLRRSTRPRRVSRQVQEAGVQQARARAPARSNRRRNETHEAAHILIMMRNSDAEETVKEVTAGPEEQSRTVMALSAILNGSESEESEESEKSQERSEESPESEESATESCESCESVANCEMCRRAQCYECKRCKMCEKHPSCKGRGLDVLAWAMGL